MSKVPTPPDNEQALIANAEPVIGEDDAPISVPDNTDSGESGRLKTIVQLVKRCLGVKDIAAMCVSTI